MKDLAESYTRLVALHGQMGQTILQLISHPDATDQQIKEACDKYKEITQSLSQHKPKIVEALYKKGYTREATQIQGARLWPPRK